MEQGKRVWVSVRDRGVQTYTSSDGREYGRRRGEEEAGDSGRAATLLR